WSGVLAAKLGLHLPVRPVKGQMFALRLPWLPLGRTVFSSGCYLLPKSDGRVLVGASMEEAGFDKQATLGVLAAKLGLHLPVRPVKGQMFALRLPWLPLGRT
ncbi:MAG: FAD-binding oxidoreductase, partial [Actinobacteria bacterium]|nr:FAD-binding oxidoreductase [Actinomycetota bacterium]